MKRRLVFALLALTTLGCFQEFESYRQLAMPSRPPGAVTVAVGPPADVFPLERGSRYDYAAHFGLGAAGPFTGEAIVSVLDVWRQGEDRREPRIAERRHEVVSVVSRYFGRERVDPYVFVRDAALTEGQGGTPMIGLFEKAPPDKITWFMPPALPADAAWEVATGEGTGQARVEAIEPTLIVPAGTYRDVRRVRYSNPGARTEIVLWLAPKVGLVRADVEMLVGPLSLKGRLDLTRVRIPRIG